ncbi:MAG: DUF2207 domain-containing protein [Arachnia sp.]
MSIRGLKPVGAVIVVLTLLAGLVLALVPATAQAAQDSIPRLQVTYDVQADGTLQVTQRIDYRFSSSGRHGIDFRIASRERWENDPSKDVVHDISRITVDSPSGAPATFTREDVRRGSVGSVDLRIGDPAQTIQGLEATYEISYEIRGALRSFNDVPQLFWDVNGGDDPAIGEFSIRVSAPGGVQRARCLVGQLSCAVDVADGVALLSGRDVPTGANLSVVASFDPGAVSVPAVVLEPSRSVPDTSVTVLSVAAGGAALGAAALIVVLLGSVRFGRNRRWAGVAPGLTAAAGQPVRPARRDDVVPVSFEPPDCTLQDAGLFLDGRSSPRHTAALLVNMAVQGAVQIQSKPLKVVGITARPLTDPLEREVYGDATLTDAELRTAALRRMNWKVARHQRTLLEDRSLFAVDGGRLGRFGRRALVCVFVLAVVAMVPVTWALAPARLGPYGVPIVVAAVAGCGLGLALMRRHPARRALEPGGTAMRDQVRGFRDYIATAEANQLNFEADRDIHRRYLPWAVLFGLTERWTKVCEQLAAGGRIPSLDTSYWLGSGSAASMASGMAGLSGRLSSAGTASRFTAPPTSPSSSPDFFSGGGSGGSSGFSSGASGGGGGGGTSISSW